MSDYVLGVDLGGTTVSVAAVRRDASIAASLERPIRAAEGPGKGLETIGDLMAELVAGQGRPPLAFGIGATGPIDKERGIIDNPFTLPGWNSVDVIAPLEKRLGARGVLENDADAFALGEWWAGAAKGTKSLYAMTIGTGIGTAFVEEGRLYRGLGGVHPEGGHMIVDSGSGVECYCGAKGCLESLVSGPAISRAAVETARARGGLMLEMAGGDAAKVDSKKAVAAARRGDAAALALMDKVGGYIGLGLVNVLSLLLPDAIVLGGGLSAELDLFEPSMRRVIDKANVMIPANKVRILGSTLGRRAGMLGAAWAAFDELERNRGK
jgi:glucokinase